MEINIGNFKVTHMSGTSTLVIGKAQLEELTSHSKTTNGVGSAYGDGSHINMSPYQSPVNDPDVMDAAGHTINQLAELMKSDNEKHNGNTVPNTFLPAYHHFYYYYPINFYPYTPFPSR
jgi:hypothetical protein